MRPRIAITLGDPRGIGPEVVAKVMRDPPEGADYVVIGPAEKGPNLPPEAAGRIVGESVEQAVALALRGEVQAIVTAPAEKQALNLAGYHYPGHTEWLGRLPGGGAGGLVLASGRR